MPPACLPASIHLAWRSIRHISLLHCQRASTTWRQYLDYPLQFPTINLLPRSPLQMILSPLRVLTELHTLRVTIDWCFPGHLPAHQLVQILASAPVGEHRKMIKTAYTLIVCSSSQINATGIGRRVIDSQMLRHRAPSPHALTRSTWVRRPDYSFERPRDGPSPA